MSPDGAALEGQVRGLATFLQLEQQARQAVDRSDLAFVMVNNTLQLFRYHQAVLWEWSPPDAVGVVAISGVDQPDRHAPYLAWLREVVRYGVSADRSRTTHNLTRQDLPERLRTGWGEWFQENVLWAPLITPTGKLAGGLIVTRPSPWTAREADLFQRLAEAYAHAWMVLSHRPRWWARGKGVATQKRRLVRVAGVVAAASLLLLPVRLSVLAPAQVIAQDPIVISSPLEGVIQQFHVAPNQLVPPGSPLFTLDDTTLRNRRSVALKALEVAMAQYQSTRQRSFADESSKAELLQLKAQVDQKSAEVDYASELLQKTTVHTSPGGLVLFSDIHDWLGKPVVVGEKIMTQADPSRVEIAIDLPVGETIDLAIGSPVEVFLNVEPMHPREARLRLIGYEARSTPDQLLAYPLKAELPPGLAPPRIGLRGTAKIYGHRVTLAYFLVRRPWNALRQMVGF